MGGLEICHVFADSVVFKQQIYCSVLGMVGNEGDSKKIGPFCGRHKCMIPIWCNPTLFHRAKDFEKKISRKGKY